MSILRNLVARERRGADPTLPWGSSYIPTNGQVGLSAAGMPMNDDTAMSVSMVYTCIRLISDSVANLDINVIKKSSTGTVRKITPTPLLVDDPYDEYTRQDWYRMVMVSLMLRGNFYGRIVERDAGGFAQQIQPIDPDQVITQRVAGKRTYRFNGQPVDTNDVVHIPWMLRPGAYVGMNPVEYMRTSWGLAGAAERYGGQFFANSANPSGVITVEEDLTPEAARQLKDDWSQFHQGISKAQYPAVLTGGAKWTAMSLNMDDAQFLQTRQFQDSQILAFFGVPPHMVGAVDRTTSWGTGIEQQEIGFWVNTLSGWTTRIEAHMNRQLSKQQVMKFDLSSRLRGDTLQRFQAYTMARGGGWLSVNEIRDREDMPPIPEGDNYLQPMNMAPLGYDPTQGPNPAPPNSSGFDSGGGPAGSSPPGGGPGTV